MRQEQGPERAEEMVTGRVGALGYLTVMRPETQALDFRCEGRDGETGFSRGAGTEGGWNTQE